MNVDDLLARLDGARRNGSGWIAKCPAHEDREASLKVDAGADGKLLLKCFGGCSVNAIVAAMGIEICDLFPPSLNGAGPAPIRAPVTVAGPLAWLASYCALPTDFLETLPLAATPDGRVAFTFSSSDARKLRRPGSKDFAWNPAGAGAPALWPVPGETLAAMIWLCEGETDCIVARYAGLPAYAATKGAGTPLLAKEVADLKSRGVETVGIVYDADPPGRDGARKQAEVLARAGIVAKVLDLAVAGLVDPLLAQKDLRDAWLTLRDPGELRRRLEAATETSKNEKREKNEKQEKRESRFSFTSLPALLAEPEEKSAWLVDQLLPAGGISILAAKPKVGKSTLARNLALAVARGESFLGRATAKGSVVYLALEEKRSEVQKHFERMGATDETIVIHVGSAPEEALEALTAAVLEHRPALVIVDPLLRLIRLRDANDYAEVTRALEPLVALARATGCHILCVHHAGKADRAGGDGILGSTALFGAVDSALIMKRREHARTVESIQRYGDDLAETVVTLDAETGRTGSGGDLLTVQLEEVGKVILDALATETLTEQDIRERLGGNESMTAKALRRLVATGQVARAGAGRRGDPYQYSRFLGYLGLHIEKTEITEIIEKPADADGGAETPAVEVFEL